MRGFTFSPLALVAGLSFLFNVPARADFVAYHFFGQDVNGNSVSNVTRSGVSAHLYLPPPIYFENFDSGTETFVSSVPRWFETNRTDRLTVGSNPDDPDSDSYMGWALISYSRLSTVFGSRRLQVSPGYGVNGQPVTQLLSNNLLYAESDLRGGNQVQMLFSPAYNLSDRTGVTLVFNSAYEQNQDSAAGVEYSIDGGTNWLPVIYMLDRDDILRDIAGNIDAVTTLNTARSDQAYGLAYSAWIGAPVTAALAPYISGRINDDTVESKRVEVFRLPAADDQPNVRLRLFHAGTASWYWGIDNWGLYSVPYTDVATSQLKNQSNGTNTSVTLALEVSGRPLSALVPSVAVPPGPETGSAAYNAFPINLDMAGYSPLHAGQTNFLDFTGLNPQKVYEIVLYSDQGAGDRSTGNRLNFTISDADNFANASQAASPLSVISGTQNETVTIDVTDNRRGDRGYVCRYVGVRSGNDGDVRITLTGAEGTCLNALKLVETTPQPISIVGVSALTETTATINGVQSMETSAAVYLCYGLINGGESTNNWEHVVFLGHLAPGPFTANLSGLEPFKKYFVALYSVGATETAWSGVQYFRPQYQGLLYATGFEPDEANPYSPGNLAGQGDRKSVV